MDAAIGTSYSLLAEVPPKTTPRWAGTLSKWWALTTNADYLESWESGRHWWSAVCPCLSGFGLVYDLWAPCETQQFPAILVAADFINFLFCLVVTRTCPLTSLRTDVLLVFGVALYFIVTCVCSALPALGLLVGTLCWGIIFTVTGLHSVAKILFLSVMTPTCVSMGIGYVAPFMSLIFLGAGFAEYRCAWQYTSLRHQCDAVQRLLDDASDGSATVDLQTGGIIKHNVKFGETYGTEFLQYRRLIDFVCQGDKARLRGLFSDVTCLGRLSPVLLECVTDSGNVFDAKVIPFAVTDGTVSLCVQVQGETRPQMTASEALVEIAARAADHANDKKGPGTVSSFSFALSETTADGQAQANPTGTSSVAVQTTQAIADAVSHTVNSRSVEVQVDFSAAPTWRPPRPVGENLDRQKSASSSGTEGSVRSQGLGRRRIRRQNFKLSDAPMLTGFEMTDLATVTNSLYAFIGHWNLPRALGLTACCPRHVMLHYAGKSLAFLKKMPCDPLWGPYSDWQCFVCTAMNLNSSELCGCCQTERVLEAEEEISRSTAASDVTDS